MANVASPVREFTIAASMGRGVRCPPKKLTKR